MADMLRVLIVEDFPPDAELCEREVRKVLPNSEFLRVETREDFLAALEAFKPDVILSDYTLSRFDGMSALTLARERVPEVPFIIITGPMNEDTAVECMKAGARDYIIKGHMKRLGSAVLSGLEQKRLRAERKRAETALQASEERFRNLLETATDWVWEVDRNGVYSYASPAVRYLLGYEPEDVLGKTPFDLMPAEEAQRVAEIFGAIAAERKPIHDDRQDIVQ